MRRRSLVLFFCATIAQGSSLWAEEPIRVGVFDFDPLCSIEAQAGAFTERAIADGGFYVSLLKYVASEESWTLEPVPGTLQESLYRLERGDIDLLVAVSYSQEWSEKFDFTQETLVSTWAQIYSSRDRGIQSFLELNHMDIGVVRDDPYYLELQNLVRRFSIQAEFVEFKNYQDLLEGLEKNWIDAGVVDRLYGLRHEDAFSVRATPLIFSPVELRYAAGKNRQKQTLAALDYHVQLLKKEPYSVYYDLLSQILGSPRNRRIATYLKWGLGSALLLTMASGGLSLFLRRRISAHTSELSRKNVALENEIQRRSQAEGELNKSLAQLDSIFQVAPVGLGVLSGTRMTWLNRGIFDLLGYQPSELLGGELEMIIPDPEDLAMVLALGTPSKAAQRGPVETRLRHKAGKSIQVLISGTPSDSQEQDAALTFSVLDISDRKRLERRLLQSQKMEALGQLAGGVAHDFNNLLTGILGYADLALMDGERCPHHPSLIEIRSLGRRAAVLTRQLLTFSRRQTLERRTLNLNDLIRDTMRILQRTIGEDIDLKFIPDPELLNVRADPGQMEQVLMNLAVNARDAMPSGGHLTIETENWGGKGQTPSEIGLDAANCIALLVTDTGCGMSNEIAERIFEPFFTTKALGAGTGLGLATVHGIVKQHGGYIGVYSEVGQGTTFRILLPGVADPAPAARYPDAEDESLPTGSETILLVEDESAVRELIQRVLANQGFKVLAAEGPEEAKSQFRRHRQEIDLVVTDMVMPRQSGAELYAELSATRRGLKVLFMSGYSDRAILETRVLRPGMPFLQKPFRPLDLARKVRQVLDRSPSKGDASGE